VINFTHRSAPNAEKHPDNWSEMVSMCANVFSTQGRSLFDNFMKMAPHVVETYFDPTNCTNFTPEKANHRQNVLTPMKPDHIWNTNRFSGKPNPMYVGQNFNKRFPRRSASFPVVPNIAYKYEDISFDSLQIGPKL
jgi:hypothetical protein